MRTLILEKTHRKLGAKMVDFAGFQMPVQYEGVNIEHQTVRKKLGVFDVSHMGEFLVEGAAALALLQKICSNDIEKIAVGGAQYNCFPNEKGGIIDDVIVYRLQEERFMLVVNAGNIEKDWTHLSQQSKAFEHITIKNKSDHYGLLAIQGPLATKAMQSLCNIDLTALKYYHFAIGDFAGVADTIISATGYTGAGGLEIYCAQKELPKIWEAILKAGAAFGIKPIGLAARDTLRLEMGYCLYGNDIDDTTSPLEAGLGWVTKLEKGDFIGREQILAQKTNGITQKRIGFEITQKGIARNGYPILNDAGEPIGKVTSGTMSPTAKKAIGMGYVKKEFSPIGTNIFIEVRGRKISGQIVKMPFV